MLHMLDSACVLRRLSRGISAIGAVGAQVGSIVFTGEVGKTYNKGDELGYFAFGGSTVIALFGPDALTIDSDLLHNRWPPCLIGLPLQPFSRRSIAVISRTG